MKKDQIILLISLVLLAGCAVIPVLPDPNQFNLQWQFPDEWCGNSTTWHNETCVDACSDVNNEDMETQCENYCVKVVQDMAAMKQASNGLIDLESSDTWGDSI